MSALIAKEQKDSSSARALRITLPPLRRARSVVAQIWSDNDTQVTVAGVAVSPDRAQELVSFIDAVIDATRRETVRSVTLGLMQSPGLGCWDRPARGGDKETDALLVQLNGNYRTADTRLSPIVGAVLRGLYGESTREARGAGAADFASVLRRIADAMCAGADLATVRVASGPVPPHH
jgi:hypothetical protein